MIKEVSITFSFPDNFGLPATFSWRLAYLSSNCHETDCNPGRIPQNAFKTIWRTWAHNFLVSFAFLCKLKHVIVFCCSVVEGGKVDDKRQNRRRDQQRPSMLVHTQNERETQEFRQLLQSVFLPAILRKSMIRRRITDNLPLSTQQVSKRRT